MKRTTESKMTKSKAAICNAFDELVLQRPFDEFHVADIVASADVSRSTFYKYFHSKKDVLKQSLKNVLAPLADAGFEEDAPGQIELVLNHIQEFKSLTKPYLFGSVSVVVVKLLASLIESKLKQKGATVSNGISLWIVAYHIAESTLGLVRAWLTAQLSADSRLLANRIDRCAFALANI